VTKELIVVVHGVGVKHAGVSADLLSTSLQNTPEENGALKREELSKKGLRPHSSDDFHLRELAIYNREGLRQTFPARIRRYRETDEEAQTDVGQERVIADFYWGDIAAIGTGLFGQLVALVKTILGLSHAIRENARDVFPTTRPADRWMRRIASGAALTIHGPIAAINAVLIIGVLVAWGMPSTIGSASGGAGLGPPLLGLIVMLGGALLLGRGEAFLTRHFSGWLLISGLVLLAFWLGSLLPFDPFSWFDDWLRKAGCSFANADQTGSCIERYSGLYLYGLRLLALMSLSWLIVFALALATGVVVAAQRKERRRREVRVYSLLMPATGLMTLLWFLTIASFWIAIVNTPLDVIAHPEQINLGIWALVPALLALVALLAAAVIAWMRKAELRRRPVAEYLAKRNLLAERYRLIVSKGMMGVLIAFIVTMLTLGLAALVNFSLDDHPVLAPLFDWIVGAIPHAMTITAIIAAVIVGSFRNSFAAVLGILTDVLTYLNDYSWDSEELKSTDKQEQPLRKGVATTTFVERILRWPEPSRKPDRARGYWRRRRIQDRLKVLVNQLIADERPDVLVIVAHSQGTVIAIDVIGKEGPNWLQAMPEGGRLKLVTMGSPYTHLHHHYFPSSFPSHHLRPSLRKRNEDAAPSEQNPGVLSRWVNIFRIDDFVGTHIDASSNGDEPTDGRGMWPQEFPVRPNGHTMYWVDEEVFPILREALAD
jgi:hypothetical protein